MTNDEMLSTALLLLSFEEEAQDLQKEIDALQKTQKRAQKDCNHQRSMLLQCVGANIQERIIPIGYKAIVITYHEDGNKLRISNRVVTRD